MPAKVGIQNWSRWIPVFTGMTLKMVRDKRVFMQIIPAILELEKDKFLLRCEELEKIVGVEKVQVDFCDGKFVENLTVQIQDIDVLNPMLSWEAHLMVVEPVDFFDYKMAGFGSVIVHLESFSDKSLIAGSLMEIKKLGMRSGLAINPETDLREISEYVPFIEQITLLSVHPGKQGSAMLPNTLERIQEARLLYPGVFVEVDGGVNAENILNLKKAGANSVVAGSALKGETEKLFNLLKDVASD